MKKTTLKIKKIGSKWWLIGDPSGAIGPYHKRMEAEDDKQGLIRFNKEYEDELKKENVRT